MKLFIQSLRTLIILTLVTGVIYPVFILLIANLSFPFKATGSFFADKDVVIGSKLIAQKFKSAKYFSSRPSASDFNAYPSFASNLSTTSKELKELIDKRRLNLANANQIQNLNEIPLELLFASGSGLDPHISLNAALFQIRRIAKERSIDPKVLENLILENIEKPFGRFIGSFHVNVLLLNILLDKKFGKNE